MDAVGWGAACAGRPHIGLPDSRVCTQPNLTLFPVALPPACFWLGTLWGCLFSLEVEGVDPGLL